MAYFRCNLPFFMRLERKWQGGGVRKGNLGREAIRFGSAAGVHGGSFPRTIASESNCAPKERNHLQRLRNPFLPSGFYSAVIRGYDGKEANRMSTLDWSQCPAVESIPDKVSGAWVFRDTRLPVATVTENLEDLAVEEVMEQFDVTREQIAAVLDFVAQSLQASVPEQNSVPVNANSL
jgi:uncharacterized protein (DUF433 family)